ncbi:hypothetical protein SMICM304S_10836 [Streptomyces microflavus]
MTNSCSAQPRWAASASIGENHWPACESPSSTIRSGLSTAPNRHSGLRVTSGRPGRPGPAGSPCAPGQGSAPPGRRPGEAPAARASSDGPETAPRRQALDVDRGGGAHQVQGRGAHHQGERVRQHDGAADAHRQTAPGEFGDRRSAQRADPAPGASAGSTVGQRQARSTQGSAGAPSSRTLGEDLHRPGPQVEAVGEPPHGCGRPERAAYRDPAGPADPTRPRGIAARPTAVVAEQDERRPSAKGIDHLRETEATDGMRQRIGVVRLVQTSRVVPFERPDPSGGGRARSRGGEQSRKSCRDPGRACPAYGTPGTPRTPDGTMGSCRYPAAPPSSTTSSVRVSRGTSPPLATTTSPTTASSPTGTATTGWAWSSATAGPTSRTCSR